ncbi:hypothetical protein EV178_006669, partial [Coemansia sp. RSA 1646]
PRMLIWMRTASRRRHRCRRCRRAGSSRPQHQPPRCRCCRHPRPAEPTTTAPAPMTGIPPKSMLLRCTTLRRATKTSSPAKSATESAWYRAKLARAGYRERLDPARAGCLRPMLKTSI